MISVIFFCKYHQLCCHTPQKKETVVTSETETELKHKFRLGVVQEISKVTQVLQPWDTTHISAHVKFIPAQGKFIWRNGMESRSVLSAFCKGNPFEKSRRGSIPEILSMWSTTPSQPISITEWNWNSIFTILSINQSFNVSTQRCPSLETQVWLDGAGHFYTRHRPKLKFRLWDDFQECGPYCLHDLGAFQKGLWALKSKSS